MNTPLILSLDAAALCDDTPLATVGGKAFNLARLHRAGFPVPPAFVLTTAAYERFVQENDLRAKIADLFGAFDPVALAGGAPDALEALSRDIRARFAAGHVPAEISTRLRSAYAALGRPPVAVRSSATAEDLPGFSFAGQHDTLLQVVGEDALCQAVIDCWSSLWTARAIAYRARNGIAQDNVSLAVVVQEMVPSQASGVLFSANPLTGVRGQTVIDATFGLGEALVSGQIEPDQYLVHTRSGEARILSKTLGSKALAVHGQEGGGTITIQEQGSERQALPDDTILALARLGRRVATQFGSPQDVEWAAVDGRLVLLQTRPITTLYPLPEGMPADPFRAMISFGAVQGVLDPITPLGRDAIRVVLLSVGRIVGASPALETQTVLWEAGERLWIDVSGLARTRAERRMLLAALPYVDPSASQTLKTLIDAGRFPPPRPRPLRVRAIGHILRALLPMVVRAFRTLLRPDAERERIFRLLEGMLVGLEGGFARAESLSERLALIRRTFDRAFSFILPHFVPRFGMGMAAFNVLTRLAATLPLADAPGTQAARSDTRVMMRGVPHNVTTEMDLALWQTAQTIRADPESLAHMHAHNAAGLAGDYQQGRLPPVAQAALDAFMQRYGMRGLAEIDLGRPRWREEPLPILQTVRSYLDITDADQAPDAVYARGRQAAEAEIERLVVALRGTRGGWIKAWVARRAAARMRALIGLREAPKFALVRLLGIVRRVLQAEGARLAAEGRLAQPDDVFCLHLRELEALAAGETRDWAALVQMRREKLAQERKRRQVPRLLLSDGQAFYAGEAVSQADEGASLAGTPVSPGTVEGVVRVVLDPRCTLLQPGEILVCPGTDPSWTPLFLIAGGLVMEVGGMMTHGAVVAREYGLPAVVGVYQATQRLRSGQRVRVDGSSGQVTLLPDE